MSTEDIEKLRDEACKERGAISPETTRAAARIEVRDK